MLASIDDDEIHARMLAALPKDIDKTEGGFAYDFTRPAALEKASMMVNVNEAIQMFFSEWSYGVFLDRIAASVGLARKAATTASGYLTVTGIEGTIIPVGFLFSTPGGSGVDNVAYEMAASSAITIGETLTAQVYVKCTEEGTVGNVPAGSITMMVEPMSGITSITNAAAMTGGVEEEDDEALRARIHDRDMSKESSNVGNVSDYKRWAQEVAGVGDVVVISEWAGAGTGTVKLVIMDSNGNPANQTILDDVYAHIVSPDNEDERLAPTGAILTVVTASIITMNISATIMIKPGAELSTITTEFAAAVKNYFPTAKEEGVLIVNQVNALLIMTNGVSDLLALTINDDWENIVIGSDEYPTIGEISLVVYGT